MRSREGDGRGGLELMVEFRGGVGRDLLSGCPLQNSWLRWDGPRDEMVFPVLRATLVEDLGLGVWNNGGRRMCQQQCVSGLC